MIPKKSVWFATVALAALAGVLYGANLSRSFFPYLVHEKASCHDRPSLAPKHLTDSSTRESLTGEVAVPLTVLVPARMEA